MGEEGGEVLRYLTVTALSGFTAFGWVFSSYLKAAVSELERNKSEPNLLYGNPISSSVFRCEAHRG